MLSWARQLPVGGEPANIVKMVEDYGKWLERSSDVPKLFIEAKPGLLSQQEREYCSGFPNQEHVAVKGLHNLQEDSPEEIGKAIAGWLKGVR
jgi:haloalkane dehalogenase